MIRDMIRISNQEIAPTIAAIANNNNPMTNTHSDQFKALLFMSIAFSCDSTMIRSAFIASTCICRTSLAPIIPWIRLKQFQFVIIHVDRLSGCEFRRG